jgi:soluble lytic murein transglycosylase-like protein
MQPLQTSLIDYDGFQRRNPHTLYDPETGIYWGAKHLSTIFYGYVNQNYSLQTKIRAAIGKYNGGPGAICDSYGVFTNRPDIENYVTNVLNLIDDYQPR